MHIIFSQDTVYVEKIIVESSYADIHSASEKVAIDSILIRANTFSTIDMLLQMQGPADIKSYGGLGNLATIQLRGTSANNTSILWNGFSLNSVTTGSADLSLLPLAYFETVELVPGASSSVYGSGTFGGALHVNNSVEFGKKFSVRLSSMLGSFKARNYSSSMNLSNNKIQYKFSIERKTAKNDYPFIDRFKPDSPQGFRDHNALQSFGFIQNLNIKVSDRSRFETGLWYSFKEKEIPELAGSFGESNKFQKDSTLKAFIKFKSFFRQSSVRLNASFVNDHLLYTDKVNGEAVDYSIYSKIQGSRITGDLTYRRYLKNITLDAALITEYISAESLNYSGTIPNETNFSLLGAGKYSGKRNSIHLNFRNEWSEISGYTPLFEFAYFQEFFSNFKAKTVISNKFRKPSFNEKYWVPGGNIHLKNESGEMIEISLDHSISISNKRHVFHGINIYGTRIRNMINWVPAGTIWTPVNIAEMEIFGLEAKVERSFQFRVSMFKFRSTYSYTSSKLFDNENQGTQLSYTPFHTNKTNLIFSHRKFTAVYSFFVTGKRFTTNDNDPFTALDPYTVSNFFLSYEFNFRHIECNLHFNCLNLLNEEYQVIRAYPSPGRSYNLGIAFTFNKNNDE